MSLHRDSTDDIGEGGVFRQKQSKAKRILHEYSENDNHSNLMNSFINTKIDKDDKRTVQISTWESSTPQNNEDEADSQCFRAKDIQQMDGHCYQKKVNYFEKSIRHQTKPNKNFEISQLSLGTPKNNSTKCSINLFRPKIEEAKRQKDHQKLRNKFSCYVSGILANKSMANTRVQMSGGGFQKSNQKHLKLIRCEDNQTIETTKYRSIKLENIVFQRKVHISSQILNKTIHKQGQTTQLGMAKLKLKPIQHEKKSYFKKSRQPGLDKRIINVFTYSGEKLQSSEQFKAIQDLITLQKI